MNDKYLDLINACLPDALIKALVDKTGLSRKDVENISIEIVTRVFGDGSDLSKDSVLKRLENVATGKSLTDIITHLEEKHGIIPAATSNVLQEILPLLFKRIATLDDKYFDNNVDDVYRNIEKKANETSKSVKVKKPLFRSKSKVKTVNKDDSQELPIEDKGMSLIDKICVTLVGAALIALIGIVLFLFIKNS